MLKREGTNNKVTWTHFQEKEANMANKMTYASALSFVLTNCADLPTDVREKLVALSDSYAKKASAEKKPTKVQVANEGVKQEILTILRNSVAPMTATDIMKAMSTEVSVQKVSALLRQLRLDGEVVYEEGAKKGVSLFRAVL